MIRYTDEEKQFLFDYFPGHTYQEIQEEFTKRFRPITAEQVKCFSNNNKINTGLGGHFRKGHTPWNKGTHFCAGGRSPETRFKKGNIPVKHRPVGSTRFSKGGYLEIKIREPNKWTYAHRVIWQEAFGEIPKGHVVVFKDGNPRNLALENLACISRSVLARLNHNHLSNSGEWFDAALATVELMEKRREAKKRHVDTE